jgi:hypothetical protein
MDPLLINQRTVKGEQGRGAKPDVEKSSEEVATEQDRVSEAKAETKIEAGTSSWWPPNWTIQFLQLQDRRIL